METTTSYALINRSDAAKRLGYSCGGSFSNLLKRYEIEIGYRCNGLTLYVTSDIDKLGEVLKRKKKTKSMNTPYVLSLERRIEALENKMQLFQRHRHLVE